MSAKVGFIVRSVWALKHGKWTEAMSWCPRMSLQGNSWNSIVCLFYFHNLNLITMKVFKFGMSLLVPSELRAPRRCESTFVARKRLDFIQGIELQFLRWRRLSFWKGRQSFAVWSWMLTFKKFASNKLTSTFIDFRFVPSTCQAHVDVRKRRSLWSCRERIRGNAQRRTRNRDWL